MPAASTDLNLLFGILAVQADLVDQDEFIEACAVWSTRKGSALSEILVERCALTVPDRALVERLVERKLRRHGGDPAASLAEAMPAVVRATLAALGNRDIDATLAPVGPQRLEPIGDPASTTRGKYSMTRLHATGGLGRVWLAHDAGLDRDVALKELLPNRSGSADALARFLREARITGQLEHPGIVPVYELISDPSLPSPLYTMRFIRGATLEEAFEGYHRNRQSGRADPLEVRELLGAFVSICLAVAYAHSRRVIHRDLKPANVVLGDFGEVMVLDWGIAKVLGTEESDDPTRTVAAVAPMHPLPDAASTLSGTVLGTPAYMAPEQARGDIDAVDERTDVHGLGAILYELLAGRPPFAGGDVAEVLANVVGTTPAAPGSVAAGVPRALEAVCMKCLAKKPEDRFAGPKEIAGEVQRYLADEPLSTYRDPLRARAGRWMRHHKTLAASLAAIVLVALPILAPALVLVSSAANKEHQARLRADDAAEREKQARATAEENFDKAVRSAELVGDELARGIKPIAGTQSATVAGILARAETVYDELLRTAHPPPRVRASKAKLLVLLSEVYRGMNRLKEAADRADQAVSIYSDLLAANPAGERDHRIGLARAHHRRGWAMWDRGQGRKAMVEFARTIELLEAANLDTDRDAEACFDLASAVTLKANIHLEFGDTASARPLYERGLKFRENLLARDPDNPAAQMQVAISCERLGLFLTGMEEADRGRDLLRRAVALNGVAFAKDRSNQESARGFIRSLNSLVQALPTTEDAEAGKLTTAAGELAETFARRDPDDNVWERENLRQRFGKLGLEKRRWEQLTVEKRIELTRSSMALLNDIIANCDRRLATTPDSAHWVSDRGNILARLADEHFTMANLGVDSEENRKRALRLAEESIAVYRRMLETEPESHVTAVGLHYSLYVADRIATSIRKDADALRRHWLYMATIARYYTDAVKRFPDNKLMAREMSAMVFRPLIPTEFRASWRELADDAMLAHFFDYCDAIPDADAGRRKYFAGLLRNYAEMKPLPERGKKLLERLSQP